VFESFQFGWFALHPQRHFILRQQRQLPLNYLSLPTRKNREKFLKFFFGVVGQCVTSRVT
jgi:hypothetical protein